MSQTWLFAQSSEFLHATAITCASTVASAPGTTAASAVGTTVASWSVTPPSDSGDADDALLPQPLVIDPTAKTITPNHQRASPIRPTISHHTCSGACSEHLGIARVMLVEFIGFFEEGARS